MVRRILLWTDLRSLLIFLGFWRLGKVTERVRWILSWLRYLLTFLGVLEVGEVCGEGLVDPVVDLPEVPADILEVLEVGEGS